MCHFLFLSLFERQFLEEVKPVDGDTIYAAHMESFQMRNVTPEYFRLFRIRTVDGEPVYDKVAGRHNVIVITPEMAEGFYHGAPNIVGRRVYHGGHDLSSEIAAVSLPSARTNTNVRKPLISSAWKVKLTIQLSVASVPAAQSSVFG